MTLEADTGLVRVEGGAAIGRRPASAQPRVTVGLPLFNAERFLGECLESIARQTYTDFVVYAIDNASTDSTHSILKIVSEKDDRFIVKRNQMTKPVMENFFDILAGAETEYFLWRAYDDYTSDNFLEELVQLLDTHPDADLAVSKIVSIKPHKGRTRAHRYRRWSASAAFIDLPHLMFRSHASWFYCLWRTEAIRRIVASTWADYAEPWGHDHLVLFNAIVRQKIVGTNSAVFFQRIVSAPYKVDPSGPRWTPERIGRLQRMRRQFRDHCERQLAQAGHGALTTSVVRWLLPAYVSKRVYRRGKLCRLQRRFEQIA